jgi:hypothetical protein
MTPWRARTLQSHDGVPAGAMQKLTLSHPPNVVVAESVPKRTLAELGKLLLMFAVRLESNLAG